MLLNRATAPSPTSAVLAYDISCPRRAYRARKILEPLHHAKQYSVFELCVGESMLRGVLAELAEVCDTESDRMAMWRPNQALRLTWEKDMVTARTLTGERVRSYEAGCARGNFIVCYDVSDPAVLRKVSAKVAGLGAMLQRSVYWLRMPLSALLRTLEPCAAMVAPTDRLWAYPLTGAHALWRVGAMQSGLLPLAAHRWRLLQGEIA